MARDLVREHGRVMAAEARHRRLVREARQARRDRRRAEREANGSWWRRRRGVPAPDQPPLSPAPAPRPEDVSRALAIRLEALAERIAERGTDSERLALHAVHDATRWTASGAAAALVDWDGSETMRLRAFGVLHGVVLGILGDEDQVWLLGRLQGRSADEQPDDRAA
jgi:hypothetical protein